MKKAINKLKPFIALTEWGPIIFAAAMFPFVVYLAACSSGSHSPTSHPPKTLLGRWQSKPTQDHLYALFEFFQDGTVGVFKPTTQNLRELQPWDQCAKGEFRFIDLTNLHIYMMFPESRCPYWSAGPWNEMAGLSRLYEVDWLDDDHFRLRSGTVWPFGLRTGGETIELNRIRIRNISNPFNVRNPFIAHRNQAALRDDREVVAAHSPELCSNPAFPLIRLIRAEARILAQ